MAGRYDLRSQEDPDTSSYAALPGTGQDGFVTCNLTPMKANLAPGREIPGCHPGRWVYELINNSFSTCDLFERARHAGIDSYTWNHKHRLVINGNQSFTSTSARALSAVCLDCRYHFVFKMSWEANHVTELCYQTQASWPLRDNMFPWHHLVWVGSDSDPNIAGDCSKYYPLLARENFVCSAPPCTFQLTLEISQPRLGRDAVDLLLDHEAIRHQLELARQREPTRYEGATDDWVYQAPLNLNTYLKNLLDSTPDNIRNISKRNKRFAVLFGPRCFAIFLQLGFTDDEQDVDGVDEGSFIPNPPPPPDGPPGPSEHPTTQLNTYRSFLEDARAEVQCLIHMKKQAAEGPAFCLPALCTDLGCRNVDNVDSAMANTERYKLLGILPKQSREIVVNAYKRQWDLMPSRRKQLVESLVHVANDLDDELFSDYAMTQSSVFDSQLQRRGGGDDDGLVAQALIFLGLQPSNMYTAEALVLAFRQKLAKDPADASTARSMLELIARASADDNYQVMLSLELDSAMMTLGTALAVLNLEKLPTSDLDLLKAFNNKLRTSKGKEESETFIAALDAVAEHIKSPQLKQMCYEQRRELASPGSAPARAESRAAPVNFSLPVGLYNIGNTCYLNSLLQYLFTVKPIRDIVLNYDDLKLDLTDESIQRRLLGGNKMQMDRGEAVVAQAFVRELTLLFQNLETSVQSATKPSQRLANAVLLSTHTLLNNPKQTHETAEVAKPPPLPARPSPDPFTEIQDDLDMLHKPVMSGNNSSSDTLVGRDEPRSDAVTETIEHVPFSLHDDDQPSVAEITVDDTEMVDIKDPSVEVSSVQVADDVPMPDVEEETVDQKVLTALEHQKRSSGTDQQDVEEVMGSIINRLQSAIRPSFVDESTGIQFEKIMQTFFVTTINYTKKFDETTYQSEVSFDRSITAFPAVEGPCSLYDALGRNFDQQILEESKLSRYTAIKSLPPILHVLIQRSQSMGSKNGNAVIIPETLYLDRYMDAPHDSSFFQQRVRDWMVANRMADLRAAMDRVGAAEVDSAFLDEFGRRASPPESAGGNTEENTTQPEQPSSDSSALGENWDFDGVVDDDFVLVNPALGANSVDADLPPMPDKMQMTSDAIRDMMVKELEKHQETLRDHREGMKEVSYRLHAVICHRGHLSSGHYWVWIRDFEDNIWRRYNDADVAENKNTLDVLTTLSGSGEPYFLCYVRDDDKDEYVNVLKRQPPAAPEPEETPQPAAQEAEDDEVDRVPAEDVPRQMPDLVDVNEALSTNFPLPEPVETMEGRGPAESDSSSEESSDG